jgi:glyoxylase-like metal-dependent hydrolase (beta-lactamase superfamily II)
MAHLERALDMLNLRLDSVRLLVCTHAHVDHYGQAKTIIDRTGCELWLHPNHGHMSRAANDPALWLEHRLEIARQSGVPEDVLRRYSARRSSTDTGVAGFVEPHRDLVDGVSVPTDLGDWQVVETPGHAPSHVCFFAPERRLLISGDHLLGRVTLHFDFGYTPDPAGEFLHSLEKVEDLDARLCLAGHGRTFTDVRAHIHAYRQLVARRLQAVLDMIAFEPLTGIEIVPHVFGEAPSEMMIAEWMSETLAYLQHLEMTGRAERVNGADEGRPERWRAV